MVKKRLRKVKIFFERLIARNDFVIIVGVAMAVTTFLKLKGFVYIDSDWFWFIAGCGLIVEGFIMSAKQRKFDNKYEVVERKN